MAGKSERATDAEYFPKHANSLAPLAFACMPGHGYQRRDADRMLLEMTWHVVGISTSFKHVLVLQTTPAMQHATDSQPKLLKTVPKC